MEGVNKMIRKYYYLTFVILIYLMTAFPALAQENIRSTIVEADGYVYLSEDKTIRQIRNEARLEAKRLALEKGKTYIKSITKVENFTLTYDLIESSTEGMLKLIDSKDYGITEDNRWHYWIKAEIRYALKQEKEKDDNILKPVMKAGPLTVDIWSQKIKYKTGDRMKFFIKGNKDYYARIIYVDAKGNKLQLVPNNYKPNNYFEGNLTYQIPDEDDRFELTVSPPLGKERIIVYASTAQHGNISLSTSGNLYKIEEDIKDVEFKTRGLQIVGKKEAEFFETNCKIKTIK